MVLEGLEASQSKFFSPAVGWKLPKMRVGPTVWRRPPIERSSLVDPPRFSHRTDATRSRSAFPMVNPRFDRKTCLTREQASCVYNYQDFRIRISELRMEMNSRQSHLSLVISNGFSVLLPKA